MIQDADLTADPTDTEEIQVVPEKEKNTLKEQAYNTVLKVIPNKDEKVFPLKRIIHIKSQTWRPFDTYIIDKWLSHASRLSSMRKEPIVTPFGKKFPWDQIVPMMARQVKGIKDPQLRVWEEKELEEYGRLDYVRGKFDPIMYLARQVLYDPGWYPRFDDLEVNLEIPKFDPLTKVSDIQIRSDAKTANTGFPWLTRLSEAGQPVTESKVYLAVLEGAVKWANEIHHLPKVTPQTIKSISPPIAVFERPPGRPVQAVSKKVVFNEYRITQPLTLACEQIPEYASGDRLSLLDMCLKLINGEIREIAKGDDVAAVLKDGRIVGADASARDASVPDQQTNLYVNAVADKLNGEIKNLWYATQYANTEAEMVNCVAMVQRPSRWGISSGAGSTADENTWLSLWHERASSRDTVDKFLSDMNRYGIYRKEFIYEGAVVFLKLYVTVDRPEVIHGSEVRSLGALLQRQVPVLLTRKADFMIEEEGRLKAIGGNMYGHPHFEDFATFVKQHWEFRAPKEATDRRAEQFMDKSRDVEVSGKYEREGIKAFTDLVSG